jgi:hypothetical protein
VKLRVRICMLGSDMLFASAESRIRDQTVPSTTEMIDTVAQL